MTRTSHTSSATDAMVSSSLTACGGGQARRCCTRPHGASSSAPVLSTDTVVSMERQEPSCWTWIRSTIPSPGRNSRSMAGRSSWASSCASGACGSLGSKGSATAASASSVPSVAAGCSTRSTTICATVRYCGSSMSRDARLAVQPVRAGSGISEREASQLLWRGWSGLTGVFVTSIVIENAPASRSVTTPPVPTPVSPRTTASDKGTSRG